MDYHDLRHFADSWGLVFLALVFLAAVGWAFRPGASYLDQADIPFRHDDRKD
jgi:cytochrome c oxidase cbb3-type subunit 4